MGTVVLEKLLLAGIDVLALARPMRREHVTRRDGLGWLYGELDDADLVGRGARSADATIHLAARHDESMERLDSSAVKAIEKALVGSNKCFITTSASPVYGDTGRMPRDEHEPINNPYPARLFRLQHDRRVTGLKDRGIRGVVIRPPFVYGRSGGFLVTLINQAIEDRVANTIGDGLNRWSTVHVDDLADLYVRALVNQQAFGVFNAGSLDTVSMREIADGIAKTFGSEIGRSEWLEADAVRRLGVLMPMMALEQRISSERAYQELGWRPGGTTLLEDLTMGSYRSSPLVSYSH
ncbi:NAD-dependent epimerase/dehydratase family protein [Rhizobium sp. Rhizsp82]|uniref:NAD-dependent epimerase/dehydratase family protein n=1 Tax=Rhizobium sp. Rhizsp82 TaxID=3243057 RepID=UPI0039B3AE15